MTLLVQANSTECPTRGLNPGPPSGETLVRSLCVLFVVFLIIIVYI